MKGTHRFTKVAGWLTATIATGFSLSSGGSVLAQVKPRPTPVKLAQVAPSICPAQLGSAINRVLSRSAFSSGRVSVLVQTLGAGGDRTTLFSRNPNLLLIPASNNKLFTTAAALSRLGADYRIRTVVYGNSDQPNLETLRIIGQGDPSLTTGSLTGLAQQLTQKGIRQVNLLIGDDTYFQGPAINPYWDREDTLAGYGAAVNSLMLNQNGVGFSLVPRQVGQPLGIQWDDPTDAADWRVSNQSVTASASAAEYVDAIRDPNQSIIRVSGQLRVGSAAEPVAVSVANPGNYLVSKFRLVLGQRGIAIARSTLVKTTPAPPGEVELAAVESPPLTQLLTEANRESNNTYTEALLKTLGRLQNPATQNATDSGIAAVKAILAPLGVNPGGYTMVDGSGLADRNRANAAAFVQTLQVMAQQPTAQVFRDSLAVAGVNGTLKNRFRNTPAQGRFQGKTGTISGVVSLSGYLTPANYPPLTLSILVNSGSSAATVRSGVDEIVLLLTRLRSC